MTARTPDGDPAGVLGDLVLDLDARPPAGHPERFVSRWRLAAAGLANVWRYGDLGMDAASGRLLLRGANGSGKTTALEALCPFLLDLNANRLAAGKARPTTLTLLMAEGSGGKRRTGYAWLTYAVPERLREGEHDAGELTRGTGERSWGVRLQYGPSSTPRVKVVPFAIPGRLLRHMDVYGPGREALKYEEFTARVEAHGGVVFDSEEDYVKDLASTIWRTGPERLATLAGRMREVRNPSLLAEVTPSSAALALRVGLPAVDATVVTATADALAESDITREAFDRDKDAARLLSHFASVWSGHVVDVVGSTRAEVVHAHRELGASRVARDRAQRAAEEARQDHDSLDEQVRAAEERRTRAEGRRRALQESEEYKAAKDLARLREQADIARAGAVRSLGALTRAASDVVDDTRESTEDLTALQDDIREVTEELPDPGVLRGLHVHGTTAGMRPSSDRGAGVASGIEPSERAEEAGDTAASDQNDVPASTSGPLLTWITRPRSVFRVAGTVADPGPTIEVTSSGEHFRARADAWSQTARALAGHAERAALVSRDHVRQVKPVFESAATLENLAAVAEDHARTARAAEGTATRATEEAKTRLVADVSDWVHARRAGDETVPERARELERLADPVDTDELAGIEAAEPGQVLFLADAWAEAVTTTAAEHAAAAEAHAGTLAGTVEDLLGEASWWRRESHRLRSGELLPLPRPDWAGHPGADRTPTGSDPDHPGTPLLGELLTWADGAPEGPERDALEVALADSGLLGATLTPAGATSRAGRVTWQVDTRAPVAADNLTTVLTVDPGGRTPALAEAAHDVLVRIVHTPGPAEAVHGGTAALVVAADGSFRAGPLVGDRLAGIPDRTAPTASFIGARQRRAAALAEADRLEQASREQQFRAEALVGEAERLRGHARALRALARTFPSRSRLRGAEAGRAQIAAQAASAAAAAREAEDTAQRALHTARQALGAWTARCHDLGVPDDPAELDRFERELRAHARLFADAAKAAGGRLLKKFTAITGRLGKADTAWRALVGFRADAAASHAEAAELEERLHTHEQLSGADSQRVVAELAAATDELRQWNEKVPELTHELSTAHGTVRATSEQLRAAGAVVDRLVPVAEEADARLRLLIGAPGVVPALVAPPAGRGPEPRDSTAHGAAPAGTDLENADIAALLTRIDMLLAGRQAIRRRALDATYDDVRGRLAGVWSLDHADPIAGLETFVLVHDEETYHPAAAAAQASALSRRAEAALAQAEDAALRRFIVGKLPTAIGVAWQELMTWRRTVNAKMKDASASSGVGVQVDIKVADDLSAAARTVYDLSVNTSDADRSLEQREEVGAAIRSLIDAADGDTMLERVSAAVDIRDWVDVTYVVTRPGQDSKRWTSRTGLSGGERRLVVLAPMLAAVAAGYDSMDAAGLRIVALDEVPAEVDEAGREGLARYLAELDLDIICTSYLWDGAPGAWDGIDAWDLEEGTDGIVVGFPMLVRGAAGLPGDDEWDQVLAAQDAEQAP